MKTKAGYKSCNLRERDANHMLIMHQSFVSSAPQGPGIAETTGLISAEILPLTSPVNAGDALGLYFLPIYGRQH